ncbi:MAG TPA: ribosome small subunit-dependent GTPase A [Actinobacteria bacterium]|nr:ribosome small subunit-dependent GTPase A [Actinomycetota bacterium]
MASRDHSRLDEDDVRVRPSRGKSRPRSKDRPAHSSAETAMVVAVDRGRWTCVIGTGENERVVTAMRAREMGRKGVVVGDRVELVGDLTGSPDALARIIRLIPRTTALRRTADDTDPVERVVVANADQLAVVAALADPAPQTRLVDRALVAAYDAGIEPLLILTKADLADPRPIIDHYAALDVPIVVRQRGDALDELRERLQGRTTVLLGASGVGKSTLVNALVPTADRATGTVNAVTGRGRHTSTSAVALELANGGWVIDTPGIRSFGIAHVETSRLVHAFSDLEAAAAQCPRGCTHEPPHCSLDHWVDEGGSSAERVESLRRLLRSRL